MQSVPNRQNDTVTDIPTLITLMVGGKRRATSELGVQSYSPMLQLVTPLTFERLQF